jgi:hypothetical protein
MSEKQDKSNKQSGTEKQKAPLLPEKYQKPLIESEDLLAFAASCNGTSNGGRKANVGAPNFCRSNRLNS